MLDFIANGFLQAVNTNKLKYFHRRSVGIVPTSSIVMVNIKINVRPQVKFIKYI